jgi:hypothetical protein
MKKIFSKVAKYTFVALMAFAILLATSVVNPTTKVVLAWHTNGVTVSVHCQKDSENSSYSVSVNQNSDWPGAFIKSHTGSDTSGELTPGQTKSGTVVIGWPNSQETESDSWSVTGKEDCKVPTSTSMPTETSVPNTPTTFVPTNTEVVVTGTPIMPTATVISTATKVIKTKVPPTARPSYHAAMSALYCSNGYPIGNGDEVLIFVKAIDGGTIDSIVINGQPVQLGTYLSLRLSAWLGRDVVAIIHFSQGNYQTQDIKILSSPPDCTIQPTPTEKPATVEQKAPPPTGASDQPTWPTFGLVGLLVIASVITLKKTKAI